VSALFVKICGVTSASDAEVASAAGADAIGINFWPGSKRYIGSLERARAVAAAAAATGRTVVGVFVNAAADEIARALEFVHLVQLHGDETPAFAARFAGRYVRAVRVSGEASLAELSAFTCPWYLLDAAVPGYGGQGRPFDWSLARRAAAAHKIVLAGGLTPENVAEAVHAVGPYGVDVASGVESAPGRKDAARVRAFVQAARAEVGAGR
jgi:phosphoribosylanthranilate isomerase